MKARPRILLLLPLLALAWLAMPAGSARAQNQQAKKKPMKVILSPGWDGCYRPRQWTPVSVSVSTPFKDPVGCQVRLRARQDGLNDLTVSRQEVLMPNVRNEASLSTRLDFGTNSASLDLIGPSGRLFSKNYDLWEPYSENPEITPVSHYESLIGVTGSLGFSILDVERACMSHRRNEHGRAYVRYRDPRRLPADWAGYASLDLLVLYDVDYTKLTIHQQRAIAEYVLGGGSVLVVMGARPLPPDSPVARMLPVRLHEPRTVRLPVRELNMWSCENPKTTRVACWQAEMRPRASQWGSARDRNGNPYLVHGPVGFGRAGVLLFDPDVIGCDQGTALASFWTPIINRLVARRTVSQTNVVDTDRNFGYQFELGPEHRPTEYVLNHLYEIEELKPIHIGWVILVLASLAVLIGPVDYLVLRAIGRLPWTWITSTACIALFSVGAYYGVEHLRAGDLQAKVVSVVDAVEGTPGAWATRYVGIFAPYSDDYKLSDLGREQWWSGLAPDSEDSIHAYNSPQAARSIYCQQHVDGGSVPYSLPINIWSMQSLLCETRLPTPPISANVTKQSRSEWSVTITNHEADRIADSFVFVDGGRVVTCGPVEPGKSKTFTGRSGSMTSYRRFREGRLIESAIGAVGTSARTGAVQHYIDLGAAVVCAAFDKPAAPVGIQDADCKVDHVLLARLVVFPEGEE